MSQIVSFLVLTIVALVVLAVILFLLADYCIAYVRSRATSSQITRLKKAVLCLAVLIALNGALIAVSQLTASTPPIQGENSIAELVEVELNGRKQWISLRAWDRDNPVLLFFSGRSWGYTDGGSPSRAGGTGKALCRSELGSTGANKSYNADKITNITAQTYIEDGRALTEYLKERFGQEKIYLVGESWEA